MRKYLGLVGTACVAIVLFGCKTVQQSADVAAVEVALRGIAVSMPPRDPFAGFEDVPRSLADIENIEDCGELPEKGLSEWVRVATESHRYLKSKRDIYGGRVFAEQVFQNGLPRHAAAFLTKIMPWDNPNWKSARMGNNAFAATFYAAYGDIDEARRRYRTARANYRRHEEESCRTRNSYWMNRAEAYLALAEGESIDALRKATDARAALAANRVSSGGSCARRSDAWRDPELDLLSATALLQLGDLNKAETYARTAQKSRRTVFGRKALQILGQIKLRQGRFQDALSFALMAKRSQRKQCVAITAPERADVNRDIALSLAALNQFDTAFTVMEELKRNLETEPELWNNLFASSIERGIVLRETGRREEAKAVFGRAVTLLENQFGSNHYNTAEARMWLALAEDESSLDTITKSLRQLLALWQERSGQLLSDQAGQSVRLKWIVEDYLSRVFVENRDQKTLGDAFEIAESLRSGMVQQALVQTALRRLAPDAKTRDLIRRQQDLQKKLGVLRQHLNDGVSYGQVSAATLDSLKIKISETESAVAQMTDAVRSAMPDYDNAVGRRSFKLAHATEALKPGEAIVALTSGRNESFVWVLTSDGRVSGRRIAKNQVDWRNDVGAIRTSIEPTNGRLDELMDFDTKTAHGLYLDLLQPLEDHWSPAKHLIFIIDNALASLPMGMLLRNEVSSIANSDLMFAGFKDLPWLIRTHAISMTPSASSFALLRQGAVANGQRLAFLGVGDPIFNPDEASGPEPVVDAGQSRGRLVLRAISTTRGLDKATLRNLPRLYDTADEIEAIADVVGADRARDIFIGSRANEATIRQMSQDGTLRTYRILSFATHGLIPGDLDGLMSPALAFSAPPAEPQGAWDDGLLTAEEIMELDLDADWVILSACNTASAQASSTEAFSGLGRAFFYAGARSLLLSNWPVLSDSTRLLMVSLFKNEATASSRAGALRAASLEIMDKGMFDKGGNLRFSYAHPLFWAPFTVVGDGGALS